MRIRTLALTLAATLMAATTLAIAASLVVFSPKEIEVIRSYYAHAQEGGGAKDHEGSAGGSREHEGSADGSKDHDGSAGGAKANKARKQQSQPLPPGIAKNLARGKPLPPGIAKQHLPTDLVRRLPPVRHGYERVVVDGRVLLVETATQTIVDAIFD